MTTWVKSTVIFKSAVTRTLTLHGDRNDCHSLSALSHDCSPLADLRLSNFSLKLLRVSKHDCQMIYWVSMIPWRLSCPLKRFGASCGMLANRLLFFLACALCSHWTEHNNIICVRAFSNPISIFSYISSIIQSAKCSLDLS